MRLLPNLNRRAFSRLLYYARTGSWSILWQKVSRKLRDPDWRQQSGGKGFVRQNYCPEKAFLARDRSAGRRIMLYVDRHVPMGDKDAGSYITDRYLDVFLSLGFRIVFWPDDLAPREPYTSHLEQKGIEVVYGRISFKTYMERYGRHFSVAFLSRPDIAGDYLDIVTRTADVHILYAPHDLNFLRESRRAEVEKNRRMIAQVNRSRQKELDLMKKSHATIVFSDREKEIIEGLAPGVRVHVSPWIKEAEAPGPRFQERSDMLFLGGFAHLPNEDGVLWFVRHVLPRVSSLLPSLRLFIVGSHPTKKILQLHSDQVQVIGFVPDPSPFFHRTRIFVAPLRYGAGLKGKVIHAMSFGLPVVTTPVGAEGVGIIDGRNGFAASDPEDFAQKILLLYGDESLWNEISSNSLSHVSDRYSLDGARAFFARLIGSGQA